MFDSSFERLLSARLGVAHDWRGDRRHLRTGTRHAIWYFDPTGFDEPAAPDVPIVDRFAHREHKLAAMIAAGIFTDIEIHTLRRLVVDRMSLAEIAAADGCSRQAVLARIVGNSRGQGGIVKKVRELVATCDGSTQ